MSSLFFEIFEPILQFLDKGGAVLYFIMALLVVLWWFIINKVLVLFFQYPHQEQALVQDWSQRSDQRSWFSRRIKSMYFADLNRSLDQDMAIIKTLIALCPLFGLMGTVTGMIEVFEVMANFGNSSPRAMASGISKAIIPTMAGMVAALTGLLALNLLNRKIEKQKQISGEKLFSSQQMHISQNNS